MSNFWLSILEKNSSTACDQHTFGLWMPKLISATQINTSVNDKPSNYFSTCPSEDGISSTRQNNNNSHQCPSCWFCITCVCLCKAVFKSLSRPDGSQRHTDTARRAQILSGQTRDSKHAARDTPCDYWVLWTRRKRLWFLFFLIINLSCKRMNICFKPATHLVKRLKLNIAAFCMLTKEERMKFFIPVKQKSD